MNTESKAHDSYGEMRGWHSSRPLSPYDVNRFIAACDRIIDHLKGKGEIKLSTAETKGGW